MLQALRIRNDLFKKIFMIFIFIALLAGLVPSNAHAAPAGNEDKNFIPYIVGGHAASQSYPGMASLQVEAPGDPDFHICGAFLVSRLYVATNAHCVTDFDGYPIDPELLHLRIGSHDRLDGGVVATVAQVLPHAEWDWATGDDRVADIALLRLDSYVQLQPFEVAPRLAQSGAVTRLLGWGSTEPSGEGPAPLQLQELDTKLVRADKCANTGITAGEICVYNPNKTDGPCYGDSGGPALQKVNSNRWSAVGSTSRGTSFWCGEGPAIYTDLTYYRAWMYEVMRTGAVPSSVAQDQKQSSQFEPAKYNWLYLN